MTEHGENWAFSQSHAFKLCCVSGYHCQSGQKVTPEVSEAWVYPFGSFPVPVTLDTSLPSWNSVSLWLKWQ